MIRTTVDEAQERLRDLIDAALRGEEVVITSDGEGTQVLRLYAVPGDEQRRPIFGSAKGLIWMSDDFDKSLEALEE